MRLGSPRASPSRRFSAALLSGPRQDGVETLVVVIKDESREVVFRDDRAHSARHGVGVTWLSGRDQLWILSADLGTSYVEDLGDGWQRVAITPETRATVPAEIAGLR